MHERRRQRRAVSMANGLGMPWLQGNVHDTSVMHQQVSARRGFDGASARRPSCSGGRHKRMAVMMHGRYDGLHIGSRSVRAIAPKP